MMTLSGLSVHGIAAADTKHKPIAQSASALVQSKQGKQPAQRLASVSSQSTFKASTYYQRALLKPTPPSYLNWLSSQSNYSRVVAYKQFLAEQQLVNVLPRYDLLRSAHDWKKCRSTEYMLPPQSLWGNMLPTLRIVNELIDAGILTHFEVTSAYRSPALNRCAAGSARSLHTLNYAIDFRLKPSVAAHGQVVSIKPTQRQLCEFWRKYGKRLNMGLGLYRSGQVHIDGYRFRTWGDDHKTRSSMCVK